MSEIKLGVNARREALDELTIRLSKRMTEKKNGLLKETKNLSHNPAASRAVDGGFYNIRTKEEKDVLRIEADYPKKVLDVHAYTEDVLLLAKEEVTRFNERYPDYFSITIYQQFAQPNPNGNHAQK